VGRGESGHEIYDIPGAEGAELLEGYIEPTEMGEGGKGPGGCTTTARATSGRPN